MEEARGAKPAPDSELPDRIFDVNFVNAAGVYEPGVLAPAEQAKLPSDSLAIVQQLVLWFPTDPRLYWLLAEVYAAKSEFSAARKIMDECVSTFTYSNRKILMQHREAVTRAADAKGAPPDEPLFATPDAPLPPPPISMRTVWIYFGAVAAVALFAVTRALVKWRRAASR